MLTIRPPSDTTPRGRPGASCAPGAHTTTCRAQASTAPCGESTIAVSAAYAEAGVEQPAPEAGPADHLGAELRFLALLCHRESEAWKAADRVAACAWIERERAFLDDHVLQWVPEHCQRLVGLAESAYHRAMFALIARACVIDRDDVEELPLHGSGE